MQNPDKLFGRLSNRMFMMAALYAVCRDNNWPIFVQDEKYFVKYKDEIIKLYSDGIDQRYKGYVGVHVRRAKNPINPNEPAYSDNPFYVDLGHHLHENMSDNYYVKAMAMFPDKKFLIFSDDLQWCKKSPMFKNCEFYETGFWGWTNEDDVGDLNAMASCEHNIIANSSFSWWAAYLNPNPNKIVIAPKQWFSDINHEQFIGLLSEWIRI